MWVHAGQTEHAGDDDKLLFKFHWPYDTNVLWFPIHHNTHHMLRIHMYITISLLFFAPSNQRTDEQLPNIIWCREPFMEALNEIEDIN